VATEGERDVAAKRVRMQPTACPELVEGAQAVGRETKEEVSSVGAKEDQAERTLRPFPCNVQV
jgi:hypothetical protein